MSRWLLFLVIACASCLLLSCCDQFSLPEDREFIKLKNSSHRSAMLQPAPSESGNDEESKKSGRQSSSRSTFLNFRKVRSEELNSSSRPLTLPGSLVLKSLPEPGLSFFDIRDGGKIYVDKTNFLEYLLDRRATFYFMARPKRFGKTCFVEMLASFFRGEKERFENLTISNRGNGKKFGEWLEYPVIHIDFSIQRLENVFNAKQFNEELTSRLLSIAEDGYGLKCSRNEFRLLTMVEHLREKFNDRLVIILIDEYDEPLRKARKKGEWIAKDIQDYLNGFYAEIIRDCRPHLGLVFVTGVSKLTLDALEVGTDFIDLTRENEVAAAMGFEEEEIIQNFEPHLHELAQRERLNREQLLQRLKAWYNNHQFVTAKPPTKKIFNPYSVIECLRYRKFRPYWTEVEPLNNMIQKLKIQGIEWDDYAEFETTGAEMFSGHNVQDDKIRLSYEMLLDGYLTIKLYDPSNDRLVLDFPNDEVRKAFRKKQRLNRMEGDVQRNLEKRYSGNKKLRNALMRKDMNEVQKLLDTEFLSQVSTRKNYSEQILTSHLMSYLRLNEVPCEETIKLFTKRGEDKGDIDTQTTDLEPNYVIEIKCTRDIQLAKGRGISRSSDSDVEIIKKFIKYANVPDLFHEATKTAFNSREDVMLLGLTIHRYEVVIENKEKEEKEIRYKIGSWLLVPYKYESKNKEDLKQNINFLELRASDPRLKGKVLPLFEKIN